MAEVTKRVCDVFGTDRDVRRYKLNLLDLTDEGEVVQEWVRDLSYRARTRLEHFIEAGLAPPRGRKRKDSDAPDATA